jgi:hypothetical protein
LNFKELQNCNSFFISGVPYCNTSLKN